MADRSLSPEINEVLGRLELERARNSELRHALYVTEQSLLARIVTFADGFRRPRATGVDGHAKIGTALSLALALSFTMAIVACGSSDASRSSDGGASEDRQSEARDVSAACRKFYAASAGEAVGIDSFVRLGSNSNISDGGDVSHSAVYELYGWGRDRTGYAAARGACLIVDGKVDHKVISVYGEPRADVAKALNIPALSASGYLMKIPRKTLSLGLHHVGVAVISADGSLTGSSVYRTIMVR